MTDMSYAFLAHSNSNVNPINEDISVREVSLKLIEF